VKYLTMMGAWLFVAVTLAGCSAEVAPEEPEAEVASSSEELKNWGGTTPGTCLDKCLSLCPTDSKGGIDAGCFLTCLGACSSKNASMISTTAVLAK